MAYWRCKASVLVFPSELCFSSLSRVLFTLMLLEFILRLTTCLFCLRKS